jgi:hypothetical protein
MVPKAGTYTIQIDDAGDIVSIKLNEVTLKPTDDLSLPSGTYRGSLNLGKIHTFESNPDYTRCVKRFGKWW